MRTASKSFLSTAMALLTGVALAQSAPSAPSAPMQPPAATPGTAPMGVVSPKPKLIQVCNECGVVQAINERKERGKPSGVGAVGGAVAGGLIGNQVGNGTGKTVATVGGAVAGGVIGNQIERSMKKRKVWDVVVKMDDGSTQTVKLTAKPELGAGQRVKIAAGSVVKI
jgi:outer membrane lipoprotein SlyB